MVNGDQSVAWWGCAGTGPAGPLVVLLTIINRPVTCSRLGGPEFWATARSSSAHVQLWRRAQLRHSDRKRQGNAGQPINETGFS